jgi:hypothetical protein
MIIEDWELLDAAVKEVRIGLQNGPSVPVDIDWIRSQLPSDEVRKEFDRILTQER